MTGGSHWWVLCVKVTTLHSSCFLSLFFSLPSVLKRRNGHAPSRFYFLKSLALNITSARFYHGEYFLSCSYSRPLAPQLAPPKIPEGERVDFDVSVILQNIYTSHRDPDQSDLFNLNHVFNFYALNIQKHLQKELRDPHQHQPFYSKHRAVSWQKTKTSTWSKTSKTSNIQNIHTSVCFSSQVPLLNKIMLFNHYLPLSIPLFTSTVY